MYDGPGAAYLTKEIINRADELFDQAETAVADDPVLLRRVKKERLAIDYVKISRQAEFLPTWQEYAKAIQQFARFAKAWGIENVSEGGSLEGRLEQWRENAKKLMEAAEHAQDGSEQGEGDADHGNFNFGGEYRFYLED
jgi:hypothetical protein